MFYIALYVIFIQLLDENRLLWENLSIVQKVFPDDEALNVDGNGDDNDDDFNDDTRKLEFLSFAQEEERGSRQIRRMGKVEKQGR